MKAVWHWGALLGGVVAMLFATRTAVQLVLMDEEPDDPTGD